ncbi:MAG: hypothetical protein RKP20_14800 [Candidatus Competibacter sp.]|nr:hypothetical protein [Candidatus Competibacter sp.]
MIDVFRRIEELPDLVRADVRVAMSLAVDKDLVTAKGERLADTWFVLGQSVEEEDHLWTRRAWLRRTIRNGCRTVESRRALTRFII